MYARICSPSFVGMLVGTLPPYVAIFKGTLVNGAISPSEGTHTTDFIFDPLAVIHLRNAHTMIIRVRK